MMPPVVPVIPVPKPMMPMPETTQPGPQTDRLPRAIREQFPDGVGGIPVPVIERTIATALKDECKRLGTRPPSRSTICRYLKRWRS